MVDGIEVLEQANTLPEVQRKWTIPLQQEGELGQLDHCSEAFHRAVEYFESGDCPFETVFSPLSNISFDPFRRLGFAFWDETKLQALAYGLPSLGDGVDSRCHIFFYRSAWQSLLSVEESKQQDRKDVTRYHGKPWA